jgi:multisubunit Na+/H+ antiporter MnhB subunit
MTVVLLVRRETKKMNWRFEMNTKTIVAAILIALGVVVLAYSGITFTTPGKPVNFLGMHFETTDSHFIPPVVGALALVGGIVLLIVNPKRTA